MRLAQPLQPGDASLPFERVPHRQPHGLESKPRDDRRKERLQSLARPEGMRLAAEGVYQPLAPHRTELTVLRRLMWTLCNRNHEIAVATHGRHILLQPGEGTHQGLGHARETRHPGVEQQIEHPEPARDEQNAIVANDGKSRVGEHSPERGSRIGLLEAVIVETESVQHCHEKRPQERVEAIGHSDNRPAAGLQHAQQFANRLLGLGEVLDRAHRIDDVEALILEWQRPDISTRRAQRGASEFLSGTIDCGF